jgi:putative Mn2+ efflux pump MntP
MPIIGWLLGSAIAEHIQSVDHWLAFGLLALIGGKMIKESFEADRPRTSDPTKGWTLVTLSIATSIDALAVGLSLAFLQVDVISASVVIGLVALVMTAAGMFLGRVLGGLFGRRMGLIGGLILVGIGLKILIEHLSA